MKDPKRRVVVFALGALLGLAAGRGRAEEGAGPASGAIRLPSGAEARYEYHSDRNALRASCRRGGSLIAMTSTGNLLRFDAKTRELTRTHFEPAEVVCLGGGEEEDVLACFGDGRVCKVDPETLALTEVAKAPAITRWIGAVPGDRGAPGRLVAVYPDWKPAPPGDGGEGRDIAVVVELASGRTHELSGDVTTCLMDSRSRLWVGSDRGEWGGSCGFVDLGTGRAQAVPGIKGREEFDTEWDGVYGFVELRDGQVWAYGGTVHMMTDAFVRRVDRGKAEPLYSADNRAEFRARRRGEEPPEPGRPQVPITHILEEPDGGLLVFAYSDIYRTDREFRRWTRLHRLRIGYARGRPDSLGSYPSVNAVHRIEGPDGGLLCATARNGYVLVSEGRQTPYARGGQLDVHSVRRFEDTNEGLLVVAWNYGDSPWRLRGGNWEPAPLASSDDLEPAPERLRLMVGPGGAVTSVSQGRMNPGPRITARWGREKLEILGRETSSLTPAQSFITPDGELWNADSGELRRLVDGRWVVVAALPEVDPPPVRKEARPKDDDEDVFVFRETTLSIGDDVRAVGEEGPPWVLRDRGLLSLAYGPGVEEPRLGRLRVSEGGRDLGVGDAIAWEKGEILLATGAGLRVYERATGKVRPAPVPAPGGAVSLLARDGLGRLWMAGVGLWMWDPGTGALHSFEALPMLGRPKGNPRDYDPGRINALAADPEHADGVVVAPGRRGVVFVRVEAQ
jgi:hypothetical protein